MLDIRKRFGRTLALDSARLSLASGEVHAVLGANGAGKTTLLSILAGLVPADGGGILIRGQSARIGSPRGAWALGVGMVHQHFTLVARLTVLENLALGATGFRLRLEQLRARASELMERTSLHVPLDAHVEALGVGERQRVEVLKVLLRGPAVLILDEPTAVLAPPEVERLMALLRDLAASGTTVVLVAHKLDEVLSVADRVTVLRDGRTVLEAPREQVDAETLVKAMVGSLGTEEAAEVETVKHTALWDQPGQTSVVARVRDVVVRGPRGETSVAGVTLEVHRGEVVGIAGVEGNGQRELAQVLSGRRAPDEGVAELPDDPAYITQDRTREGLIASFTLAENFALALHRKAEYRRGGLLRWGRVRARARELLEAFAVRPPDPGARAGALSGGNQQRVVVARELGEAPELLVAENPTRGLDVAASSFVHRRLRQLPDAGVVLVSTDLDEVLRLADRVLVMVRGRLHPVPADSRTREGVGRMMLAGWTPPPQTWA
jgi:simple sugar transport system ATP-binding protein